MANKGTLINPFRTVARSGIVKRSSPTPPSIDSSDYIYDRVHRIEVYEEIPQQFADVSSMDGWRQMVRAEAFKRLLDQVPCDQVLTIECRPMEKSETTPDQRRRYFVGCELRYTTAR